MTFACPPEGQLIFEVQGNFLTPDHHVAKGRGEWSMAGALAEPDTNSTTKWSTLSTISSYKAEARLN